MDQESESAGSWMYPGGRRAVLSVMAIVACMTGFGVAVYASGGTAFAWVHLMYIPIIVSGALFRLPGGVVSALAAGTILGPFMPLSVSSGIPQETANWVLRTGFFLVVGVVNGFLFNSLSAHFRKLRTAHDELVQAHEELRNAQFRLIQAAKLESVGRLAAGIAHEVKNPLATIQLGVDFLSKTFRDNREMREVAEDMDNAVKRADTVIKGLLDFSRAEKLDLTVTDLNGVIEDALLLVRHELEKKKITVEKNLDRTIPTAEADRGKIEQVFINLFMNAVHAMGEGGLLVVKTYAMRSGRNSAPTAAGKGGDRGGSLIVAEVNDSGTGIPEEKLDKVFDPFFTTKGVGQGTGLGLSVSRKILELHRASIDIRNRKEGGVSVVVMLPQGKEGFDAEEKNFGRR
ncbi:MAG: ATP-binding protein [Nitrospirae bacterium]|nr:ATP-binding protein [Nitrospirota bacterium]